MRAAPTFEVLLRGYLLPHRRVAWLVMEERLRQAADFARLIESTSDIALTQVGAALRKLADRLAAGRASPARS
jgi:hypothetical protein